MQATALSPDLVGISFSTTLSFNSGVSQSDQAAILSTASAAAANYINNLAVGAPLVINQLASAILTSDSRIQDIGDPKDEITQIFIWGDGPMGRALRVSDGDVEAYILRLTLLSAGSAAVRLGA